VAQFHSAAAAGEAQEHFERVYQRREAPEEVREVALGDIAAEATGATVSMTRFLVEKKLVSSRAEAKRLLAQGAIEMDGQKVTQDRVFLPFGALLRVGRHTFARIVRGDG
jgi:tyrosyl-tRNA synthetase